MGDFGSLTSVSFGVRLGKEYFEHGEGVGVTYCF
jgi:hypothetical protein